MTNERINELVTHKELRHICDIRKLWLDDFNIVFDISAFRIIDRDSDFELNSRIEFPYAIVVDNNPVYGHLSVHLRKGVWYFDEQGGNFKMSSFDSDKYKDSEWFNKIDKLLFKTARVCEEEK